jgi:hypothetical protein
VGEATREVVLPEVQKEKSANGRKWRLTAMSNGMGMQTSFFEIIRDTSCDRRNLPVPETCFADLQPGDHFRLLEWDVKSGWRLLPKIFVRVLQETILDPNAKAIQRDDHYPWHLEKTIFFGDVAVECLHANRKEEDRENSS